MNAVLKQSAITFSAPEMFHNTVCSKVVNILAFPHMHSSLHMVGVAGIVL